MRAEVDSAAGACSFPGGLEDAPRRIGVGKVIGETFSLYGAHAGVLLGTALVVFVVVGIIQGLLTATDSVILALVGVAVNVVGLTLYTGFVVKVVEDVRDGRRDFTVSELLSAAAGAVLRLIGNGILKAIAVAIGFVLLIVPGLILLTIWAVTAPAIVVERAGALEAFGRSRELVRGNGWPVFGVILVAFLITFAIQAILGILGEATSEDAGRIVAQVIGAIITAPISALVASVLFFDLGGGLAEPEAGADENAEPTSFEPPGPPPAAA